MYLRIYKKTFWLFFSRNIADAHNDYNNTLICLAWHLKFILIHKCDIYLFLKEKREDEMRK